ncbi:BtpA/SgcQ family protein [Rhodobacter sp. 24-YEA-8]|uniref:BtpA/SgcQ family protein n=1 Tax=Rhodobacter sp. 24-YEA-8 TaxID=1884310 RepID=UPI000AEA6EFB|nr:BtpA/SgcQ family protein [Rhodobacter sp. 24-YEA-8]
MRARQLDRKDLVILNNVSAEFAVSPDSRPLADRARSAVFSSIRDAVLVSGAITGESAQIVDPENVKKTLPDTPVLANSGVKHGTVEDVLKIADGCVVGSSLKVDGHTWNAVDPKRAREFMDIVRKMRG